MILLVLFLPCHALAKSHRPPQPVTQENVSVVADSSLSVPLSMIARHYSRDRGVSVSASYGSSKTQIDDIASGADEADVFIGGKTGWIKTLQQQGLIDIYTRTVLAKNQLSLVGPAGSKKPEAGDPNLLHLFPVKNPDFQFAFGDPQYLAEGTYAFDAVYKLKLARELEPFFSILDDAYTLNTTISKHGAYGMVFHTDALLHPEYEELAVLPETSHDPMQYQAVVIVGRNMKAAREFLAYLQTPEVKEIFQRYGFDTAVN